MSVKFEIRKISFRYLIYFTFIHCVTSDLDYVPVTQSTLPLNCQDQHQMCYYWLHNNECSLNEIIPRLCPKGCKLCEPKPKPIYPRSTEPVLPAYETQPSSSKRITQPPIVLNQTSSSPFYHTDPKYFTTKSLSNNNQIVRSSPSLLSSNGPYLREALEVPSVPINVSELQKSSALKPSSTTAPVSASTIIKTVISPTIPFLPTSTVSSTFPTSSSTVGKTTNSPTANTTIRTTFTTLSVEDPFQLSLILKPVKGVKSVKPIDSKDLFQEKNIQWGEWTSWGKCTIGRQFRTRTCGRDVSKFCSGSDLTFRLCNILK